MGRTIGLLIIIKILSFRCCKLLCCIEVKTIGVFYGLVIVIGLTIRFTTPNLSTIISTQTSGSILTVVRNTSLYSVYILVNSLCFCRSNFGPSFPFITIYIDCCTSRTCECASDCSTEAPVLISSGSATNVVSESLIVLGLVDVSLSRCHEVVLRAA